MIIDFNSSKSTLLLNPRLDSGLQDKLNQLTLNLDKNLLNDHFFLATSGTTKQNTYDFKLVALSKNAILTSAKSVNHHLGVSSKDNWLNCLPTFHVGGLGILARAHLSNSKVYFLNKWNLKEFLDCIYTHLITLTSLVPAQVYDICKERIKAPDFLRVVVVGGGALASEIYHQALDLGWPLVLSYGLTECASQVATSAINSDKLKLLSHVEAALNEKGQLMLKSDALLTAEIFISDDVISAIDLKKQGWFTTEDFVELKDNFLTPLGRSHDFIKIGGESVLFSLLEKQLEEIKIKLESHFDSCLVAFPDKRLGHVIHLAATEEVSFLVDEFNKVVMPYERVRHVHILNSIPRTDLKKVKRHELLQLLRHLINC